MSKTIDAATGVVSVAVFGISGSFSPEDAAAWSSVIVSAAPAILILFLIWRINKLDKQHSECNANWIKTQSQLALAYRALQGTQTSCRLPTEHEFMKGEFNLDDHPSQGN